MDTRRCALFLIKCVQGFAAISRRWMTWKCNFQCLSLLLLAKAFFLSHASFYSCALEITFSYSSACVHPSVSVCFLRRYVPMNGCLHVPVSFYWICLSYLPVNFCEHPQLWHTAQLHSCCTTLGWTPLETSQHPNQRLFLDTMPSPC